MRKCKEWIKPWGLKERGVGFSYYQQEANGKAVSHQPCLEPSGPSLPREHGCVGSAPLHHPLLLSPPPYQSCQNLEDSTHRPQTCLFHNYWARQLNLLSVVMFQLPKAKDSFSAILTCYFSHFNISRTGAHLPSEVVSLHSRPYLNVHLQSVWSYN